MEPQKQGEQPGDEPTRNSKAGQVLPILQASRLSRDLCIRAWPLMHQASEDLVLSIKIFPRYPWQPPGSQGSSNQLSHYFQGRHGALCLCKVLECLYRMTKTEKPQAQSMYTHAHARAHAYT